MRIRWVAPAAAVAWLCGASAAQAPKGPPTVEVRLRSVNDLFDKAEYVAGLAGQDEVVKQVKGIVKQWSADGKGIEGVDPARPFGLTATLTADVIGSPILVLVPVADQDRFLAMLKDRLNLAPEKGADGTYTIPVPVVNDLHLRFANGYVYVARSAKDLDPKTLQDPKAFFGKDDGAVGSVLVRFDTIPKELVQFVTGQLELALAEQKRKLGDNPTAGEKAAFEFVSEVVAGGIKTFVEEAKDLRAKVFVDPKADELSAELSLTAKPGTTLAKNIAALGGKTSLPAGIVGAKGSVARFSAKGGLPDDIKASLGKLVDAAGDALVADAPAEQKELARRVVRTVAPTLKAGEVDAAAALTGPDAKGRYAVVVALGVKGGKEIEALAKDLAKDFGPLLGDAAKFEFDVAKEGEFALHTITLRDLPPDLEKLLGPAKLWLATSPDVIALSVEPDGAALKAGLRAKAAPVPVLSLEVEAAKLLPVVGQDLKPDEVKAALKEAFGDGSPAGKDTVSLTVTGGDQFTVKAKVKGKAVKLLFALDQFKIK
jgi:hypothetical protein